MYSKIISVCIFAILLLESANAASASSTVKLEMFGGSNAWWVAVKPLDDNSATIKVEVKDAATSAYATMQANPSWGYYTYTTTAVRGFKLPLTFRLTPTSGSAITVQVNSIASATVDSGAQFGSSTTTTTTTRPTTAPTTRPATTPTTKPTTAPTTKPTAAPTTKPTAPTTKPTTPTTKPTNPVTPTTNPTAPTTAPPSSNTNLCSVTSTKTEPLKLLVPLYVYPGAAWDQLIAAASKVKIIAIINPNSGPLTTVDSTYSSYMTKLNNAGIEMVGYVHTLYGGRDLNTVKSEIDTYASKYPLVKGIFLDEAANEASQVSYYTQVYNYIMSKSGYAHAILNPGVQPDAGYLPISTNIVIFENFASSLASTSFSSWVKCAPNASQKAGYKYKFSGIVHTASASSASSYISTVANMGMGLVYITDGAGGCCTYNTLVSYFAQEASLVAAANA